MKERGTGGFRNWVKSSPPTPVYKKRLASDGGGVAFEIYDCFNLPPTGVVFFVCLFVFLLYSMGTKLHIDVHILFPPIVVL